MIRRALLFTVVAVAFPIGGATAAWCAETRGTGPHRATVVVQFADDRTETRCVSFSEESITGIELLRRSGVAVVYEDHGGGQLTVCRIGGVGCDHPRVPCFCECADTRECTYWGYYGVRDGSWTFHQEGAAQRVIRDGAVDGWRWARQTTDGNAQPTLRPASLRCGDGVTRASAGAELADDDRAGRAPGIAGSVLLVALVAGLLAWQISLRRRRDPDA